MSSTLQLDSALNWVLETAQNHSFLSSLVSLLVLYAVYEQVQFTIKKRGLPGPTMIVPFIGEIVSMVVNPFHFWHSLMDNHRFSITSIIGYFVVLLADYSSSRQIFESTNEDMPMALHPSATKILGANNIAFMNGAHHKQLRYKLLPLFTKRALGIYLSIQDRAIRHYMSVWFDEASRLQPGQDLEMKSRVFLLNTDTSLSVFVGKYLTPETRAIFQADYKAVTNGFLAMPINLPGTALNLAIKARKRIVINLTEIAGLSKKRMALGEEPECLIDFWMVNTIKEIETAQAENKPPPVHSSDSEIGHTVLDFLFASQDASTASLTWVLHFLCEYPDVLAKVRAEHKLLRPNGETITPDLLDKMQYTWQVMKEILRFRPPATIVPHIAHKEFSINDKVVVPKGALVIPSVWAANREGWTNPDKFDVDRFSPESTREHDKYFLTFGIGPHACLGQRYAMNHIMLFISLIATEADITRKITENSSKIMYAPTIYPADGCVLASFTPRKS